MTNYGMFTEAGNAAVQKIVDEARALHEVSEYGLEPVWNWAVAELDALSASGEFEEALDTAVREAVYNAII